MGLTVVGIIDPIVLGGCEEIAFGGVGAHMSAAAGGVCDEFVLAGGGAVFKKAQFLLNDPSWYVHVPSAAQTPVNVSQSF